MVNGKIMFREKSDIVTLPMLRGLKLYLVSESPEELIKTASLQGISIRYLHSFLK